MNLLEKKLARYDIPQKAKAAGIYPYFRAISSEQDCEVVINGKKILMFGSNSYLGLTNHPKVKEAAIEATRKYGTGCAGSRFLNGTLDIHEELERKIAKWIGKEEAIVYSTGFQVNLGVVSSASKPLGTVTTEPALRVRVPLFNSSLIFCGTSNKQLVILSLISPLLNSSS